MIFNLIGGGSSATSEFPEFTYSGTYNMIDDGFDESTKTQNWRIKFLTTGILRFTKVTDKLDVFMVGGGAGGGQSDLFFGGGGGGGYVITHSDLSLEKNTDYTITIGGGGNQFCGGGTTSAFGYSIGGGSPSPGNRKGGNGGSGGGGGTGGSGGSNGNNGAAGVDGYAGGTGSGKTTYEFGESSSGVLYAGGGGGAGEGGGYGGSGGGGRGDYSAGTANTGGGGGGGHQAGFGGGSGIVILRNSRAVWA